MSGQAMDSTVSPEEIAQATQTLAKLEPGRLPLGVFLEVARLTVTPIVEVVPLRKNTDGKIEVLLTQREDSDPVWGGMLHTPGTVLRANDSGESNADAFERIIQGELGGVSITDPKFIKNVFHDVKRGKELAQIYYVEVHGDPVVGQFYDASNLPDTIVDSQIEFIQDAVRAFETELEQLPQRPQA